MKDEKYGRMVAAVTLKKYIARCDEILSAADRSAAEVLEREIVAVFKSDFTGLTQGLDMYGVAALNGIKQADHIKDIGILKARLQKELDAIEPESCESSEPLVRQKMIFISHSSKASCIIQTDPDRRQDVEIRSTPQ